MESNTSRFVPVENRQRSHKTLVCLYLWLIASKFLKNLTLMALALATLHSYLHRPVVGPGELAHSTHNHYNTVNVPFSVKDMAFTISMVSLPAFIWKGSFIKTLILLTTKVFCLNVSIRKYKIILFLVNRTNQGWSILKTKWEDPPSGNFPQKLQSNSRY